MRLRRLKPSISTIRYDWQFKDGRGVWNGKPWEQKWLADILSVDYFHNVTMVSLSGNVTDADMACLGSLSRIDTLVLDPSNLTEIGVEHLDRLTRLRWLTIYCAVGHADNQIIRLKRLKSLGRLRGLNLDGTDVTDAGVWQLDGLTDLELLGLERTNVTDACLTHLGRLTALQNLFLNQTQVSDKGLVHLKGMGNLARLHLKGTKVTAAGVRELKKALPKVEISW